MKAGRSFTTRVDPATEDRVDDFVEVLQRQAPTRVISQHEAIATLIEIGLTTVFGEDWKAMKDADQRTVDPVLKIPLETVRAATQRAAEREAAAGCPSFADVGAGRRSGRPRRRSADSALVMRVPEPSMLPDASLQKHVLGPDPTRTRCGLARLGLRAAAHRDHSVTCKACLA